jgi:hypothetical protein
MTIIDHPPRTGWIPQVLPQGRLCCRGVGAFLPDSGWFRDPIDLICRSNHVDVFESLAEKKTRCVFPRLGCLSVTFAVGLDLSVWGLFTNQLWLGRSTPSPTKKDGSPAKMEGFPNQLYIIGNSQSFRGKSSNGGCSIAFYLISNSLDEASLAAWKLSHHCCQLDDLYMTCCTSPSTSQKSRHVPLQIWRTCSCLSSEESGYCTRPLSASRNWSFIDPYTHCIQ